MRYSYLMTPKDSQPPSNRSTARRTTHTLSALQVGRRLAQGLPKTVSSAVGIWIYPLAPAYRLVGPTRACQLRQDGIVLGTRSSCCEYNGQEGLHGRRTAGTCSFPRRPKLRGRRFRCICMWAFLRAGVVRKREMVKRRRLGNRCRSIRP